MNSADKAMAVMRRQIRELDEVRLINKRAYSIWHHMRERAEELGRLAEIDFNVEWLRERSRAVVGGPCCWCARPIKAKNFSWDHQIPITRGGSFSMDNLQGICSTCNGQKGNLTYLEFTELRAFLLTIEQEAKADILRRLGLGARWRS